MSSEQRASQLRPSPIDETDRLSSGTKDRRTWFSLPYFARLLLFLVPYALCVAVVSSERPGFGLSILAGSLLFLLSVAMPAALGRVGTITGIVGCVIGVASILIWVDRPISHYFTAIASFQVAAIGAIVVIDSIARSNERYLADLRELALTDGLTSLYNRRTFEDRLGEEWSRSLRNETELSVLLIDIDSFKTLNDTRGHAAGDAALQTVAEVLRSVCRVADVPCRVGGDEFAVIVPETGLAGTEVFALRLLKRIRDVASDPTTKAGEFTISVGVATGPAGALVADALVANADAALYRSKRAGGDTSVSA